MGIVQSKGCTHKHSCSFADQVRKLPERKIADSVKAVECQSHLKSRRGTFQRMNFQFTKK